MRSNRSSSDSNTRGETASPTELVTTLGTWLDGLFSDIRERVATQASTTADDEPTDQTSSQTAPDPEPPRNEDSDEQESFPVLTEDTERSLHDVLLDRGVTREEYICELLAGHDGRLRQQQIKEFTGWSAASVSRLLGQMEGEGTITRFRIGNEKVVCFPDADPRVDIFETEIPVST